MRQCLIKLALGAFILTGFFVNCACGQTALKREEETVVPSNIDLSTEEAVLKEVQKRLDAKSDAAGERGGRKLDANSVCVERMKESKKIIVIGYFRNDFGCYIDGAFVDSRYFEITDTALSKEALATLGWVKAQNREREMLANSWVQNGLLVFFNVLQIKDKDLRDSEFHPPLASAAEDGDIRVTLWIQMPPRMRREKEFKWVEYIFAKDGKQISARQILID